MLVQLARLKEEEREREAILVQNLLVTCTSFLVNIVHERYLRFEQLG